MLENIFNLLVSPNIMIIILILYMIGSLPFAVIISKLLALPDPRSFGSNNPGATNVLRGGNKFGAILTLLGDSMKGYIPVLVLSSMGMQIGEIYFLSFIFSDKPRILALNRFKVILNHEPTKPVLPRIKIFLFHNYIWQRWLYA